MRTIGDGTHTMRSTPVKVSHISNATNIPAGVSHSCALLDNGTIKCWGYNGNGRLGDGTTNNSLVPVDLSGITNAIVVVVGSYHSCARLNNGGLKCWGIQRQWSTG